MARCPGRDCGETVTPDPKTVYNGNMAKRSQIYSPAEIAARLNISRQAIKGRMYRGGFPKPDYTTVSGRPLWRETTLVRAGVFEDSESDDLVGVGIVRQH